LQLAVGLQIALGPRCTAGPDRGSRAREITQDTSRTRFVSLLSKGQQGNMCSTSLRFNLSWKARVRRSFACLGRRKYEVCGQYHTERSDKPLFQAWEEPVTVAPVLVTRAQIAVQE